MTRLRLAPVWLMPIALVLAQAGYLAYLAVRQRRALFHFDEDLAIYDQIVWNTAHGRLFASTLIEHADNMLGDHFAPAVALFAPLYWVYPNPNLLLIGQALALAGGALPVFAFARCRLGSVAAVLVAAAWLAYPALHLVALFQFHEIVLIVPPLALALLAIERGWRRTFVAAAVMCLLCKEEVAIVVAGLAPLWWLRRRDPRMAAATLALGVGTGFLTMGVILPRLNTADSGYYYVRRYAYLGETPLQMAATLVTRPGLVLETLTTPDRLRYLAGLFLPLLLLPLLGWEYLVAALPVFGYLLLATSPDQYALNRHYLVPLVPLLFFGAVLGLGRVATLASSRAGARPPPPGWTVRSLPALLASLLLTANLAAAYVLSPLPFLLSYDKAADPTLHTRQLLRLIEQVPPDAPVAASRNLLSPFSRRVHAYRFPNLRDADYVLLDFRELRHPAAFGLDGGAFGRLLESPDYRMADAAAGAVLFVRGDPGVWPGQSRPTRVGDVADLLDYRVTSFAEDGALDVTLVWRAIARPTAQYTAFVHLLDGSGNRVAQSDSFPVDGLIPTDTWLPGRVIVDTHTLRVQVPPGVRLQVGLYDGGGRRLPIGPGRAFPGPADTIELPLTG
jgi:uncharacterized membrane protein